MLGFAPLGYRPVYLVIVFLALVATALLARGRWVRILAPASLLIVALTADQTMQPLPREFMTPLDEGMVMDMPITVPRAADVTRTHQSTIKKRREESEVE